MTTWRAIAAAIAAFCLAATVGCNADTSNEDNAGPEPAVQDGGQRNADEDAMLNDTQPGDEAGAGNGQANAGDGGDAEGAPGDQPADLPMPIDQQPLPDDPAADGEDGDGTVSIMPVIEPAPETEILPAVPEPVGDGPAPSGNGSSGEAGGVDPNTPVSKQSAP
jgi:hypothetical protein